MKKNICLLFLVTSVLFLFNACVKDTDFNQTDAIELTPLVELDFIFFNINSQNFTDIDVDYFLLICCVLIIIMPYYLPIETPIVKNNIILSSEELQPSSNTVS